MKPLIRFAAPAVASLCLALQASAPLADEFPSRAVRFVAPYPQGSVTDILARTVGQKLTESWKQPVVVENRGGGGSVIGTDLVAKAPADGYTLLLVAPDLTINQSLHSKLPYDAEKSFAPVSLLAYGPMALNVHPSLAVASVAELIAYAKARPGKLSYASGGNGTVSHLGMELFKHMAGVDMVHVPYKGTAAVVTAVLAGDVQVAFAQVATVRPQAASGKVRPLAVASAVRSQAMPELPTVAEAGVAGFRADVWFGVVVPGGTPAPVVARLNREIRSVIATPEVRERLLNQGIEPVSTTPEEFAALIRAEIPKWAELVRRTGARVD